MSTTPHLAQPVPFTFEEQSHAYMVNGVRLPSVTQILKWMGYSDYSMVAPEVLEYKRKLGKLVHQAAHYWDEDKELLGPDGVAQWESMLPEVVLQRLRVYQRFQRETGYKPIINEHRMIGELYGQRYPMQLDSFGQVPSGQWWLLDIKNASGSPQRGWGIQTMAYVLGIRYMFPIVPANCVRVILQLSDDDYRLHLSTDPKSKIFTPYDAAVWQNCLGVANDLINSKCWKWERV